jgi:dihydroflavonol-4-reductase
MRVLVTGASEFIGVNVVRALCAEGHDVLAYVEPTANVSYLAMTAARLHPGDLGDRGGLLKLMRGVDAVANCAGAVNLSGSASHQHLLRQVDIEGTRSVVEAAIEAGVRRFVHTSTTATIGAQEASTKQWAEDTPLTSVRADDPFVRAKLEAEAVVRAAIVHGLETIILNPAEVIGPWDHGLRGWGAVIVALAAQRVVPIPAGTGSFASGTEVGRAHVAALVRGAVGSRYVLAGSDSTYADLFAEIRRQVERPGPPPSGRVSSRDPVGGLSDADDDSPDPYRESILAGHYRFDASRAVRDLGYRVVPISVMVEEAYDWYRAHGFIPAPQDP